MTRFRAFAAGKWPSDRPNTFSLVHDRWDDYHFKTTFVLHYAQPDGDVIEIGAVKIARTGMGPTGGTTELPKVFERVGFDTFSVGQDREYYERLMALPHGVGIEVLASLRDIAFDEEAFEQAQNEPVSDTSLFRYIDPEVVEQQFRRIARGGKVTAGFQVSYDLPVAEGTLPTSIGFDVEPGSMPPTNVHVLIGSNGVGKTTLLRRMSSSLLGSPTNEAIGGFASLEGGRPARFAGLVAVAFSAFDPFIPEVEARSDLRYTYVGLKGGSERESVKTSRELAADFAESLAACSRGPRRERWQRAMRILSADPNLQDSGINELLSIDGYANEANPRLLFDRLSSGHKIVVLTTTRLIESVEERTLVLIDEPEAHLHPPLLSSFMRVISDLLEDRNGVAIVATHSPVVLQEVPSECVNVLYRSGDQLVPARLDQETFGEGVGVLTASVFGLEVTRTGFHQLLVEAASTADSYEAAVAKFGFKLGGEARAILRALSQQSVG